MKSFEMVHVAEIEYNGALMLGLAGWGASVAESPEQATSILQAMGLTNARHPADWHVSCAGPLDPVDCEDPYSDDWKSCDSY